MRPQPMIRIASLILAVCGITQVSQPVRAAQSTPSPITLPAGYAAEVVDRGLNLPTHLAYGPDGALYVTQLNGGENDGSGQVVRIAKPGDTPQVVLDHLLKPTGLAWVGNDLYIVARNTILLSHDQDGTFSTPQPLFKDLPFNGRSNGQIFVGPDGMLYFQSTGTEVAPHDSGFIYTAKPGDNTLSVYARGFKNAYAMTWDNSTHTMYATEIGDGAIPGGGQPPEKLVVVKQGADYGWPTCYAIRQPNPDWGGTTDLCAKVEAPLAMFAPEATPTGLAVFDGQLIVALWNGNPARLVSINPATGTVTDWASGFKDPIALLTDQNGSLLVVDFLDNSISRIRKTPPATPTS